MAGPIPSLRFEREAWKAGAHWVAGVDEVGVGPLAGPVTAGMVALPAGRRFKWYRFVRDSKVLNERVRDELAAEIKASVPWALGWASHEEIDRINILQASLRAMAIALAGLACPRSGAALAPDYVLVDGIVLVPGVPRQRAIPQGDARSLSIGAASIVAKVTRDRLMEALDREHPEYGFARHKGYPTPEHLEAIRRYGVLPIHRRTFRGVREHCLEWTAPAEAVQADLWGADE